MSNNHYCQHCGAAFETDDPQMIFCPLHRDQSGIKADDQTSAGARNMNTIPELPGADQTKTSSGGGTAHPLADWKTNDTILDTYEVKGELGKGGFGKVYRVHHKSWNIDLAVKRALSLEEDNKQSFIDEAQHWIDLGLHPHIISCYYVRNIDGFPHTFAELAEGRSLHDWIQRKPPYDLYEGGKEQALQRMLDIAIQFARGLAYAHQQELVHQDVKPQNALMTPDGMLKVTDFGLAKARGSAQAGRQQGQAGDLLVSGGAYSPYHCSPEQASGEKLSLKTDIWSWAVSILEMFNGGVSWMGGQVADTALESYLQRAGEEEHIPPMPQGLADLLRQCLQPDSKARPVDMLTVAEQLLPIYQQETGQAYPRQMPKAAELRADSLNNKALSLLDLGKEEEAVDNWQKALKDDPHHTEVTYNYGLIRWRNAEWTDIQLVQAMESTIVPDKRPWIKSFLLGLIHLERADGNAAEKALSYALSLSPGNENIQAALRLVPKAQACCVHHFKGHSDHIWETVISSNHRLAATASADGTVRLWDLINHCLLYQWDAHGDTMHGVVFTPDNRRVISAGNDKHLRVWNTSSGKCEKIFKAHKKGWAYKVAVSSDGKYVISGGAGGDTQLEVWDLERGKRLHILKGHTAPINEICITPDGSLIVSSTSTGDDISVRIWEMVSGRCLKVLGDETEPITLTPDGRYLLTQGTSMFQMRPLPQSVKMKNGNLHLWDLSKRTCLGTVLKHKHWITSIAFDENRKHIATIGDIVDDPIRIRDLTKAQSEQKFSGFSSIASAVVFVPGGQYLLTAHKDGFLRMWQRSNGRCLRSFSENNKDITRVFALGLSKQALTVSRDNILRLWKLDHIGDLKVKWMISRPYEATQALNSAADVQQALEKARENLKLGQISKAGEVLDRALKIPGYERDTNLLEIWRQAGEQAGRRTGIIAGRCLSTVKGFSPFMWVDAKFVLSPSQRFAAFIDRDSNLGLWDFEHAKVVQYFKGHGIGFPPRDMVFNSSGTRLISVASDRTIRIWDTQSAKCLSVIQHSKSISAVALTQDNKYILSGNSTGELIQWDHSTGKHINDLNGHRSIINQINVLPGGKYAISCSNDRTLRVWDLDQALCLHLLEGHTFAVFSQVISPNYRFVLSGSGDKTLRLWEIASGRCLYVFKGHTATVTAIAITSDGKIGLSASQDNTIRLWDLVSGESLGTLEGHTDKVYGLALLPDNRFALTSSEDRTIRIWDLEAQKCLSVLEGHTGTVTGLAVTNNGRYVLSGQSGEIRQWQLDWNYTFLKQTDWDDRATPTLKAFLVHQSLIFKGAPKWSSAEFDRLMTKLKQQGLGWLREEGVRKKLAEMAAERD